MHKDENNSRNEEDRRLMIRYRRGEQQAYDELVDRHHENAIAYAYSILEDWALAEDAVQEALIKVYQNAADFREDMVFKTWFLRIVRNQSYNDRRKRLLHGLLKFNFKTGQPVKEVKTPEELTRHAELSGCLGLAIRELPEKYRTALELCDLQGLSIREAALIIGSTQNTVAKHVRRGRRLMRRVLVDKYGLTFDELLASLHN